MSTSEPAPLSNVHHLHDRAPVTSDGRAYGGPAHGQQWAIDLLQPPPWVELPTGFSSTLYRLARHPRTGRPARDHLGNLLYVPLSDVVAPAATRDAARTLPFPGSGQTGRWSPQIGEDTQVTPQVVSAPTPSTGDAGTRPTLDEDVTG